MRIYSLVVRVNHIPPTPSASWDRGLVNGLITLVNSVRIAEGMIAAVRILTPIDTTFQSVKALYELLTLVCAELPFTHQSIIRVYEGSVYTEEWEDFPPDWRSIWGNVLRVQMCDSTTLPIHSAADCSDPICPVKAERASLLFPAALGPVRSIAFGGSFDGLHAGHKILLEALMEVAAMSDEDKEIVVGVSDDDVVFSKPGAALAQSSTVRIDILRRSVDCIMRCRAYLRSSSEPQASSSPMIEKLKLRYSTVIDIYQFDVAMTNAKMPSRITLIYTNLDARGIGAAGDTEDLQCLLLTSETLRGLAAVNAYRSTLELKPLVTVVCPLILAKKGLDTDKLSSRDERGLLEKWLESEERQRCFESLRIRWKIADEKWRVFLRYHFLPFCAAGLNLPELDDADAAQDLSTCLKHLLPCMRGSGEEEAAVDRLAEWFLAN